MKSTCALVSILAVSAFAAASAQALPEYGRCLSAPGTGPYKDSACTIKSPSEKLFAWSKTIEHPGFTLGGGETVLETASGNKLICSSLTGTGKYVTGGTSIKSVRNVLIVFSGCTLPISPTCRTVGHAEGVIATETLSGNLLYTDKAKRQVALELRPAASTDGTFLAFECGAGAVKIQEGGRSAAGSCMFVTPSPANSPALAPSLAFTGNLGIQTPNSVVGSTKRCNLESRANGGAWEKADISAGSVTVTNEEAIELKA